MLSPAEMLRVLAEHRKQLGAIEVLLHAQVVQLEQMLDQLTNEDELRAFESRD